MAENNKYLLFLMDSVGHLGYFSLAQRDWDMASLTWLLEGWLA